MREVDVMKKINLHYIRFKQLQMIDKNLLNYNYQPDKATI